MVCLSVTLGTAFLPVTGLAQPQLPTGCRNNETRGCAQRLELERVVEGLAGGPGNNTNVFVVDIRRPGIYTLETTRHRRPGGGIASLRFTVMDSEENRLLSGWLNGSRLERTDLIEISVPGEYYISVHYSSGSSQTPFTVRLRPRRQT